MIGNVHWFQTYHNAIVKVMAPRISDHAQIRVRASTQVHLRRTVFKFLKCVTQDTSYLQLVARSWQENVKGSAMYRLWKKMLDCNHSLRL